MNFEVLIGIIIALLITAIFAVGFATGADSVIRDCIDYSAFKKNDFEMTCKVISN
jgi:peptidoglycan biosynthesis protein MviN/MurJ (putative lipid II flippase)